MVGAIITLTLFVPFKVHRTLILAMSIDQFLVLKTLGYTGPRRTSHFSIFALWPAFVIGKSLHSKSARFQTLFADKLQIPLAFVWNTFSLRIMVLLKAARRGANLRVCDSYLIHRAFFQTLTIHIFCLRILIETAKSATSVATPSMARRAFCQTPLSDYPIMRLFIT